jgi:hypothetical protein
MTTYLGNINVQWGADFVYAPRNHFDTQQASALIYRPVPVKFGARIPKVVSMRSTPAAAMSGWLVHVVVIVITFRCSCNTAQKPEIILQKV